MWRGRWKSSESASAVRVLPTPGGPLRCRCQWHSIASRTSDILQQEDKPSSFPTDNVVEACVWTLTQMRFTEGANDLFLLGWHC